MILACDVILIVHTMVKRPPCKLAAISERFMAGVFKGFDMHMGISAMRWVFGVLYVLSVVTLAWWIVLENGSSFHVTVWILIAGFAATQAVFFLGVGSMNLCSPMRKRRLIVPVLTAGLMMTVLLAGLLIALSEVLDKYIKLNNGDTAGLLLLGMILLSWLAWSVVFFIYTRKSEKYRAAATMVGYLIAGSWLQLLVTVPSHVLVSRRPGCFVGLGTGIGICAGIVVMIWAFGPGIWLMFLKEKHDAEARGQTVRFAAGLRKAVFYTICTLMMIAAGCLAGLFIMAKDIGEPRELAGYFPCLLAFLIFFCVLVNSIRKGLADRGLITTAVWMIWPAAALAAARMELYLLAVTIVLTGIISLIITHKRQTVTIAYQNFAIRLALVAVAAALIGAATFAWPCEKPAQENAPAGKPQTNAPAVPKQEIVVGNPFGSLAFTSAQGSHVSLEALRGKVVIVQFWATWCGPCREEIPALVELYRNYHDTGLEILGISLDNERAKLDEFVAQQHVTWPQYVDGQGWNNAIASRYGISGIPHLVVVDRNGIVVANDVRGENLATIIKEQLK